MRELLGTLLVALPLAGAAAPAAAQLTTFSSRAAFAAVAGPVTTESFDQPFRLVPTAGATYAITGGTVAFDANHGDQTFGGGDLFADLHPAGDAQGPRFLRFTFAAPVTAFGADFGAFDSPSLFLRALVGGTTFNVGEGFFGVVSTVPFTTVELRDPTARTFFVVDNASISASVVPEPTTVWLVLGGLAVGAAAARRRRRAALVAGGALALGACADRVSAPGAPAAAFDAVTPQASADAVTCAPNNGDITLPAGFCAAVVADSVLTARHLAVAGNGDVYVAIDAASAPGGVLALRDADGDGRAEVQQYFGAPDRANGIAVVRHALYVAYRDRVVRYQLDPGTLVPTGSPEVIVSGLPTTGDHFRKNMAFDGRNTMWVNIGSASNACQVVNRALRSPGVDPCPELPTRAAIWRFDANRLGQTLADGQPWAQGFRNTEALRYDPARRALFGVPHGRDMLADNWPELFTDQQAADLPSEELHRIDQGDEAGWPYCYHDWQQGAKFLAPEYGGNGSIIGPRCATAKAPLAAFPGHWASNDVLVYNGAQFPGRYAGGAFVAFHGGFDRAPLPNEGYNVVFVPASGASLAATWEVFADGFTGGGTPLPAAARHRPMGLAQGADGSLYVSDDRGGRIWRIVYRGE